MSSSSLRMRTLLCFAAVCRLVTVAGLVSAQSVTGTISGTVLDTSGQAIPGATVTVVLEGTGESRTAVSQATGDFTFPALRPGTYTVRVEFDGFRTYERRGNVLTANDRLSIGTISLEIGQLTDTVSVTAQGTTVETTSSENAALISSKQIEEIAVRGRDVVSLLKMLPGVSYITESESLGGNFGTRVPQIQGAREGWSTVTVDGLPGNDLGTPAVFSSSIGFDAISEVKVQLNNYRAESGRTGGAVVNIVTKSGTSEFHGSLYGYLRNERLNANDFFNNRNGIPKPEYRHKVGGANLGGPLFWPSVFNEHRDKMFFFYSAEKLSTRNPQPLRQLMVPTELERRGDFSQSLDVNGNVIVVRDPLTGQPFPGNIVPANRINPHGQALLNRFPLPNALDRGVTGGNYNYQFQESTDVPKMQHFARVDFRPSAHDSVFVRGLYWKSDNQGYAVPAGAANWGMFQQHYTFLDRGVLGSHTHVFSSNLVNELRVGVRRSNEDGPPIDALDRVTRDGIGFGLGQLYPQNNPLSIMPQARYAALPPDSTVAAFTYDGRFPITGDDTVFSISNDATYVRGAHTIKAGAYYEYDRNIEGAQGVFAGNYIFTRDTNNPLDTNYAYANGLLGIFQEYTESSTRPETRGRAHIFDVFAQDTWKALSRLTIDYGLRLAWYSHWEQDDGQAAAFALERYDPARAPLLYRPLLVGTQRRAQNPLTGEILPAVYIGAYVPGTGDPTNGMVSASDETYPKGFRDSDGMQVEPRAGFAYDIAGNGKTAIRGGFGIFHNVRALGGLTRSLTQQPPAQFNPRIFYGTMDTVLSSAGVLFPSNVIGVERQGKTPVLYNYSVGVQRDIGWDTVMEASYIGSRGRHLQQAANINLVPAGARFLAENQDPTSPGRPLPDNFFRPFPGLANITFHTFDGESDYNALQVAANRRFTQGLQFGLSYTLGEVKNRVDTDGGMVETYLTRDYVRAGYNQTHNFVFNYTWALPRLSRVWDANLVRAVFDNWMLSGITTFSSGFPLTLSFTTVDGADITGGGDPAAPALTGDINSGSKTLQQWFNTSAVARPARGDAGDSGRNVINGPGVNNWDITLFKNISMGGARVLQFRWEIYNVFNTVQFLDVDRAARFDAAGNQVNARFGQVISARTPRIMQASLRFNF